MVPVNLPIGLARKAQRSERKQQAQRRKGSQQHGSWRQVRRLVDRFSMAANSFQDWMACNGERSRTSATGFFESPQDQAVDSHTQKARFHNSRRNHRRRIHSLVVGVPLRSKRTDGTNKAAGQLGQICKNQSPRAICASSWESTIRLRSQTIQEPLWKDDAWPKIPQVTGMAT